MNIRNTLLAGSALGLLGVALGAFGAHALKHILTASGRLETFELAIRYQFYHAFALLITGLLQQIFSHGLLRYASISFLAGTVLFSGSLYLLSLTQVSSFGIITPFGGLLLLAGWIMLMIGIAKSIKYSRHPLK